MVKKVKKTLLFLSLFLALGGSSVYASEESNVYDDAGLLTESEIASLNDKIETLETESGWNVYAVTTADAEGKTATAYADDFFDTHSPEQEDGVALLIDMDNREITISTCGEAIRYLTDARIDSILDDAYTDVSNGDYGDCLITMVDGVERYYQKGISEGQYNYDTETGEISRYHVLTPIEIGTTVVVALLCALIIYFSITSSYKMRTGTYQYAFRENSTVNLRVKQDRFVNETVTHRRIQQSSSGGGSSSHSGRSSTHHSSSGRSHGGGSRKF